MPTAIVIHFTAPDDLDGPEVDAATEALIAEGAALGLSFDGAIAEKVGANVERPCGCVTYDNAPCNVHEPELNPWGIACMDCSATSPCASCATQIKAEWGYITEKMGGR